MMEIGYNQGEAAKALLDETQKFTDIQVLKDLADKDRIITAVLKGKKAENR